MRLEPEQHALLSDYSITKRLLRKVGFKAFPILSHSLSEKPFPPQMRIQLPIGKPIGKMLPPALSAYSP